VSLACITSEQRFEEVEHAAVLELGGLARLLKIVTFSEPFRLRDPRQTFRKITSGRNARSA